MNTSLLRDENYIKLIENTIKQNIEKYADQGENPDITFIINDQLFMETLKMEIRKSTIQYSSKKKRETEKQELELKREIEEMANLPNPNEESLNRINELNLQLEALRQNKIKRY